VVRGGERREEVGENEEESGENPFCSGKTLRNGEYEKKTFLLSVYEQKGFSPRAPFSPKNFKIFMRKGFGAR